MGITIWIRYIFIIFTILMIDIYYIIHSPIQEKRNLIIFFVATLVYSFLLSPPYTLHAEVEASPV